jgi:plastocyanin
MRLHILFVGSLVSLFAASVGCSSETGAGSTSTSSSSSADASTGSAAGGAGGAGGAGTGGSATGGSGQGGSGTGGSGTGGGGGSGGAGGAGPAVTNGCTDLTATDQTGKADVTITKGMGFNFTPPCVKVSAGTKVTFTLDFTLHPLVGGTVVGITKTPDPNSPIKATSVGSTVTFTMPDPGTFGFYCAMHAPAMAGAVYVVP